MFNGRLIVVLMRFEINFETNWKDSSDSLLRGVLIRFRSYRPADARVITPTTTVNRRCCSESLSHTDNNRAA